ncbi:hypothetical protein V8E55_009929 [Tylopilus felleus]
MAINYASYYGIKSLPAAIVYFPFFIYFFTKAATRPIYVYIVITLFCARTVQSDADNIHVFLAYEIIYNTGFFGLLYSAYSLVTARVEASKNPPNDLITRILRHHFLLGITVAVQSQTGSTTNTSNTLRRAAIYIFLVCSLLVFLQTFFSPASTFFTATANTPYRQNNEILWYPLAATIEFIAVVLFATPGLVPDESSD